MALRSQIQLPRLEAREKERALLLRRSHTRLTGNAFIVGLAAPVLSLVSTETVAAKTGYYIYGSGSVIFLG